MTPSEDLAVEAQGPSAPPAGADATVDARRRERPPAGEVIERLGLVIAWVAAIVVFGILSPDVFLTQANFATILGSQAVLVIVTLGLLIPLTAGDYDLSIAGTLSLSAMLVAVLNAEHVLTSTSLGASDLAEVAS